MTCVVCGQGLIEAARAPRQPDRHRWCSAQPGRHLPAGLLGTCLWVEPAYDALLADGVGEPNEPDLTDEQIEARFAAAKAQLRRAS